MFELNANPSAPVAIKETLKDWVERSGAIVSAVLSLKLKAVTIRGKIRGTDKWALMGYVGIPQGVIYLKNKLLVDAEVVSSEDIYVWSHRRALEKLEAEVDVLFVYITVPYHGLVRGKDRFAVLPDWINMIVPIHEDWEKMEQGFNKTTRKQIRRNPYQFEFSRDPDVIEKFYDEFYVPYVSLRHEDASIDARKVVERRAKLGGILRVIGEDGPIVSGVVFPANGVLYYFWLGMAERYLDNQPDGALFASYYFFLRYAHENGFETANWMGTRSFPTDGVFQFKRKWGAQAHDSFSPDAILFKPAASNEKAIAFAETFPVLARRGGALEQVFCTKAETVNDADIKRIIAPFECGGVDQITIAQVSETAQGLTTYVSEAFPQVRVIKTSAERLPEVYGRAFVAPETAD